MLIIKKKKPTWAGFLISVGGQGGKLPPPKHLTLIKLSSIKSQQYTKSNY